MTAKLTIAAPTLSDEATLTAPPAAPGAPVSNLQTSQPGEVWRTNNAIFTGLHADLGAAAAVRLIALLYTNLSDQATWSLSAGNDLTTINSTPRIHRPPRLARSTRPRDARGWRHVLFWLEEAAAARANRYWQITLADYGNPDGWLEAGRLVMAEPWQPQTNLDRGYGVLRQDPSVRTRMAGGQLRILRKFAYDEMVISLSWLSRDEAYHELAPLLDYHEDLLVMRDPTAADWDAEAVYGPLERAREFRHPYLEYYKTHLTFTERTP